MQVSIHAQETLERELNTMKQQITRLQSLKVKTQNELLQERKRNQQLQHEALQLNDRLHNTSVENRVCSSVSHFLCLSYKDSVLKNFKMSL